MAESMMAKEISETLGVGVNQIYKWFENPNFPAVPIGKNGYIVFRTTLNTWLSDPQNITQFRRSLEDERSSQ